MQRASGVLTFEEIGSRVAERGRRLSALMLTDLVGYTALTQRDEAASLRLLEEHRQVVRPLLHNHAGREVKTIGDAFLVEFRNALDATRCAVAVQESLHERNAKAPGSKIKLRIGLHVGDVIHQDRDIYGDAVNLLSRIGPLAEPGGICVSGSVFEEVQNKVPYAFEALGPTSLKGVLRPIEVYRLVLPWQPTRPATAPSNAAVADETRVAVLPFVNMSPDPTDEYFADGMTEELIDRLAQLRGLTVIARTSVMTFKNASKKASEIAKELSVGSLIEGSVRKAGDRVRVTVQLVNGGTEGHLWSDRYDRDLGDIFAVQTEIAERVAGELNVRLHDADKRVLEKRPTTNTEAYGLLLRGRELHRDGSAPFVRQALTLFQQAIELDPRFARAHVGVAQCHQTMLNNGFEPMETSLPLVRSSLERALELDPDLAEGHAALAEHYMNVDNGPAMEAEATRALELNSSLAAAHHMLSTLASQKGDLEAMVREAEIAYGLDPLESDYILKVGEVYFYTGREKEALEHWEKTEHLAPRVTLGCKTEYYLSKGNLEKAEELYAERAKLSNAPNTPWMTVLGGILAAHRGDKEQARLAIRKLEQNRNLVAVGLTLIAAIYDALGDLDLCFDYLNQALEAHTLEGFLVMYSTYFTRARADPRYPLLLRAFRHRLGFVQDAG